MCVCVQLAHTKMYLSLTSRYLLARTYVVHMRSRTSDLECRSVRMFIKTTIIYGLKIYSMLRCICSQHLHAYSQFSASAAGVFFSLSEPKDGLPKPKGPCVHVPIALAHKPCQRQR